MDPRSGVKDYVRVPVFLKRHPSAALGMTVLGERIGSQGWCAAFLEDGILVSQPSPLGEGAPQGRIGRLWYERQLR